MNIGNSLRQGNFTCTFFRKKSGDLKNPSSVIPHAVAASTQ